MVIKYITITKKQYFEKMSNDGSSATLSSASSVSESVSLTTRNVERKKHERRTQLTNKPFSQSETPIICMYMHSAILSDAETDFKKCVHRLSPFQKPLVRYINAAPGEGDIMLPVETISNINFDDPLLTPSILFDQLNTEYLLDVNPMNYYEVTNFGFDIRKHKIINYYQSPYCFKSIGYEEEKIDSRKTLYDGYYGIYVMNSIPNFIKKNTNLCFYKPFIDYVKKTYSTFSEEDKNDFFKIQKVKGKEYLHELNNEVLYNFLAEKVKSIFFIDWGCETDLLDNIVNTIDEPDHPFFEENPPNYKFYLDKVQNDIDALFWIIDEDVVIDDESKRNEYMEEFLKKDPIKNKEYYDTYQTLLGNRKFYQAQYDERVEWGEGPRYKKKLQSLQKQKETLTRKQNKTTSDKTKLADLNKEIKTVKRDYYKKSKVIQPTLRNLKVFQANAKRNKGRVHVTKRGDNKIR